MSAAPLPPDETARLQALYAYEILDTEAEAAFDDLAALAAAICGTPIALVSLLDADRQWFKSAYGTTLRETPRQASFCAHAIIESAGTLMVPDTRQDTRFSDNPLVTGAPFMRAYAAAVLESPSQHRLGTVCVLDVVPRQITPEQVQALQRLARQAVSQLELRRAVRRLHADAAERERAAAALVASERLYRELVENAQGMICTHDLAGNLRMVNSYACTMLGYAPEELVGRNIRDVIAPEQSAAVSHYLDVMRTARTYNGVLTMVARDGTRIAIAYQNFRFDAGHETYVVGHGVDITDRVKSERASKRFAAVLQASPDFVGLAEITGRPFFLNRAGRNMCGLVSDALPSTGTLEHVHSPAAQAIARHAVEHALEHGSWSGENTIRHADGHETPVLQTIIAPRGADGRPEFIATIARDVSEAKRTEAALLLKERRFRHVVENVREVLFETDRSGHWTFLNPAWTEITGFDVEESLGDPLLDYIHRDDLEFNRSRIRELIDGTVAFCRHEARYVTQKGDCRWLELHAVPVIDPLSGRATGTIGTLRDVTSQHELAQQLVRARESAEQTSRLMSDFVANMSHEVRTPLNGVMGLTAALLETPLTPEQRQCVASAHQSGQVLLAIVNDLLDLSKIEAGKMTIERIGFDLRQVVSQAVEPATLKAHQKKVGFKVMVSPDLPEWIMGDPIRVRQVLLNLADNAVKFTTRGTVSVAVTPSTIPGQPETLRMAISDSGTGIPKDRLSSIFEKFKQADTSTTRQYGGSGLGLTICRQLVELMGGRIDVKSEPGRGSTFWFDLPLEAAPKGQDESAHRTSSLDRLEGALILVAEDNPTNQLVAKLFLEKLGCVPEFASDGAEAVACANAQRFDAILMDAQMPVLDGYQASMKIREGGASRDVPIIAMTASAMTGARERCLAAGMTDFLSKPVQEVNLMDALDRALSGRGAAAQHADGPTLEGGASYDPEIMAQLFPKKADALKLASLVVSDVKRNLANLSTSLGGGDWATAGRSAHSIAGIAANVSAMPLADIARQVEEAIVKGERTGLEPSIEQLTALGEDLVGILEAWIKAQTLAA